MLNEGIVSNNSTALVKSEMVKELHRLGRTTPDEWERAVFESITGQKREDVDWDVEDNQAGYYTWIKAFDRLITELEEDGYLKVQGGDDRDKRQIIALEVDDPIDFSHLTYRPSPQA